MKPIGGLISSCAPTGLLTAQPSLRITSPTDRTTVYPGDTLTVTVDVSPPAAFGLVFVAGGDPVGFSKEKLDKPPYRFTLQIPRSTRPDKYPIAAAGFTSINRELLNSHSITVLVERADSPVSLTVYPVIADFTMDQKRYFPVTGLPLQPHQVCFEQRCDRYRPRARHREPPFSREKRPSRSPTTASGSRFRFLCGSQRGDLLVSPALNDR